MKKITRILCILMLMLLLGSIVPMFAAASPYSTYTYSINGQARISPDVYVPDRVVSSYEIGIDTELKEPKDIFIDKDMNIYLSDTGNNRIVVCNSEFKFRFEISTFNNEHGVPDSLSEPMGTFVNDKYIYVCDKQNARIVVFDLLGNFVRTIGAPTADVMGEDTVFTPVAIGVSDSGRMYVVSAATYSGVFALDEDGNFQTFVGTQKVSVPLAMRIRRMLFPNTVSISYISPEYNNLAIDDEGYVWVTSNSMDDADLISAIESGNADYAPVKRMNSAGDDITTRNGFFIPAGEISFDHTTTKSSSDVITGPSSIVDVAIGPNGMWSILDEKRSKIYTYDSEGNLLFAFGDKGAQLGNLKKGAALVYFGSDLYVVDSEANSVTIYKRTEYGDVIDNALYYNRLRIYSSALENWREILKRNNNFDAAYVGVGRNLHQQSDYKEAMKYFKTANSTTNYSDSYKALRREWIGKYFLVVVAILVVVLFLLAKGLGYVAKVNKNATAKGGKRTFKEEVLYAFYVMMHPFDGYWDLKHEKRGSVRASVFIVILAALSVAYNNVGSGYLYSGSGGSATGSIFGGISTVVVPLLLWCIANWCLTTLFDGEGTLKDIFIASSYSLMPIPVFFIPVTIVSNFATLDEKTFISLFTGIALVWTGMLLFFGIMTTHGYSMGVNIGMTIFTIVAMMFIVFLIMLFTNLIQRMVSFVTDIITEISYRSN